MNAGTSMLEAVEVLGDDLGPGDVVLIKGRDTQRLDRVALALMSRAVRYDISFCNVKLRYEHCPMLERGWKKAGGRTKSDYMKFGQYNTACAITSPLTLSVAASAAESKSASLRGAAAFDFAALRSGCAETYHMSS